LRTEDEITAYKYLNKEYSSADNVFSFDEVKELIRSNNLMLDQEPLMEGDLLI
jgi:hypothetical protein